MRPNLSENAPTMELDTMAATLFQVCSATASEEEYPMPTNHAGSHAFMPYTQNWPTK